MKRVLIIAVASVACAVAGWVVESARIARRTRCCPHPEAGDAE